jgi:hypothetical protein
MDCRIREAKGKELKDWKGPGTPLPQEFKIKVVKKLTYWEMYDMSQNGFRVGISMMYSKAMRIHYV